MPLQKVLECLIGKKDVRIIQGRESTDRQTQINKPSHLSVEKISNCESSWINFFPFYPF